MMNRKRNPLDESYKEYRASQDREAERVKQHLLGKYVHVSKSFTAEGRPMMGVTRVGSFKND
jgi:hypothetical protein